MEQNYNQQSTTLKQAIYWTIILLFNYGLTLSVHYSLRPLWFDGTNDHTSLTTFEMFFTMGILPFMLVIVNYWLAKKYKSKPYFFINAAIICSCIFISSRLHFLNWADSIGSRTYPDTETLMVINFETCMGLAATGVSLVAVFIRIYKKNNNSSNSNQ